jgi:hypothetical protein
MPVVHLDLGIFPRIFEKNRNDPNTVFRGFGKKIHEKNKSKKSRDTVPFNAINSPLFTLFFVIGKLFNALLFRAQASQLASRLLPVSPQTAAGFAKKILFLNAELSLALRQPELALRYAAPLESLIEGRAPPFVLVDDFDAVSFFQCCGSGMFISDPNFSIRDPNHVYPGSKVNKIPDPG